MRIAIMSIYVDYERRGRHRYGELQPQVGPLIAALLPAHADIEIVNDAVTDPDWNRDYDLVFLSCLSPDFDRARQVSHYWRRRGATTVFGGIFASIYPRLCTPYFDSVVVGDPEGAVARVYDDFVRGRLLPLYVSGPYDPASVPTPRFDLLPPDRMSPASFEVTRGCPFDCNFCALTSIGTRHHTRPVASVLRDIRAACSISGSLRVLGHDIVSFVDNNLGGNLAYLRELCAALEGQRIRWGAAMTFNVIADRSNVRMLSRAGCRAVFVGLESLNPATLEAMGKFQNRLADIRTVLRECRRNGIYVTSGLMLSPVIDDLQYVRSLPSRLWEVGLPVPTFVAFEAPLPGTPAFLALAEQDRPALLPNVLLRDLTGYTLATRPVRVSVEDFVAGYVALKRTLYSPQRRARTLLPHVAGLLAQGHPFTAAFEAIDLMRKAWDPQPGRTFVAGSDTAPPEATSVPLRDDDFDDSDQRGEVIEPWPITDAAGWVLPRWRHPVQTYLRRGSVSPQALGLARTPPR
jgi:hypothetical protein